MHAWMKFNFPGIRVSCAEILIKYTNKSTNKSAVIPNFMHFNIHTFSISLFFGHVFNYIGRFSFQHSLTPSSTHLQFSLTHDILVHCFSNLLNLRIDVERKESVSQIVAMATVLILHFRSTMARITHMDQWNQDEIEIMYGYLPFMTLTCTHKSVLLSSKISYHKISMFISRWQNNAKIVWHPWLFDYQFWFIEKKEHVIAIMMID